MTTLHASVTCAMCSGLYATDKNKHARLGDVHVLHQPNCLSDAPPANSANTKGAWYMTRSTWYAHL